MDKKKEKATAKLFKAVKEHKDRELRKMLDSEAANLDLNLQDREGLTPLGWAATLGNLTQARMLVEAGADAHKRVGGEEGNSYLLIAAAKGHRAVFEYFCDIINPFTDTNNQGHTVLTVVARVGSREIVECVLQKDPPTDFVLKTVFKGRTALHLSAMSGNAQILHLLLDHLIRKKSVPSDTFIDAVDDEGASPLLISCVGGHLATAQMLIDNGANPNHLFKDGSLPFNFAAASGNVELAKLLLSKATNKEEAINHPNRNNATPLLSAVKSGSMPMVELLLGEGADVSVRTRQEGTTCLHIAALMGDVAMVTLLLKHNASPAVKDNLNLDVIESIERQKQMLADQKAQAKKGTPHSSREKTPRSLSKEDPAEQAARKRQAQFDNFLAHFSTILHLLQGGKK
mmetsp:Transcript_38328/g.96420  ORF Transcript_38328/g.96420 Transcript_38328/m.96420 type:complete len:401 (-) Transcript_38328:98-1300(-)